MYALVNLTSGRGSWLGRIISIHRWVSPAERADARLQRRCRRAVGAMTAHVPTKVVRLRRKMKRSDWIQWADSEPVNGGDP